MKRFFTYCAVAVLALCAVSCNESKRRKALLPNISGKPGEVIVVINKGDWEGALGNVREADFSIPDTHKINAAVLKFF